MHLSKEQKLSNVGFNYKNIRISYLETWWNSGTEINFKFPE